MINYNTQVVTEKTDYSNYELMKGTSNILVGIKIKLVDSGAHIMRWAKSMEWILRIQMLNMELKLFFNFLVVACTFGVSYNYLSLFTWLQLKLAKKIQLFSLFYTLANSEGSSSR